jgi:DNA excision repair protein ERCC-6-like 2
MSTLTVRLSQSTNEVPKKKAKKLSLEEKVNRMEGEEESSSDLDIMKVVRKELDLSQYIDGEWRNSSST